MSRRRRETDLNTKSQKRETSQTERLKTKSHRRPSPMMGPHIDPGALMWKSHLGKVKNEIGFFRMGVHPPVINPPMRLSCRKPVEFKPVVDLKLPHPLLRKRCIFLSFVLAEAAQASAQRRSAAFLPKFLFLLDVLLSHLPSEWPDVFRAERMLTESQAPPSHSLRSSKNVPALCLNFMSLMLDCFEFFGLRPASCRKEQGSLVSVLCALLL